MTRNEKALISDVLRRVKSCLYKDTDGQYREADDFIVSLSVEEYQILEKVIKNL